jgi:DNA adenine methylase
MEPVTIRLINTGTIPPSSTGRRERIENNLRESSPISSPMHAADNAIATSLQPIAPVRPPAPYLGGKRNLAKRLVAMIAAVPHETYVEPFVGMGGVFLRRDAKPRAEVMNDISGDVVNLFRILQRHYEAFVGELRWKLTSREDFDRLRAADASTLTDLERAARFLYLQRLSFGGKVQGRNFGVDRRTPARFDITKLEPLLAEVHERLASVTIEQLPYADLIRRYDGPAVLFYLDPPYVGCETDYGNSFAPADFERLADQLATIAGRFILSINDTPLAREIFGRFDMDEVTTTYTISTRNGGGKRAGELVISRL